MNIVRNQVVARHAGRAGAGKVNRAARGFTIAEIIVVVIIIGVLATIVATRLVNRVGQARSTTAGANANAIASAVESFLADTGYNLQSGTPLESFLMERPADVAEAKWQGPYMKNRDQLLDPWGKAFMLVVPGKKNVDFDIVSYGNDGQPGGEGDNADIVKP
jgi:general secretion pathway protein G